MISNEYLLQKRRFYSCLAALGLVENSATNVVAAMLVSPLMVKFFDAILRSLSFLVVRCASDLVDRRDP